MAYLQSAVVRGAVTRFGGRYRQTLSFSEADAADGSEWSVDELPPHFDVISYKATLVVATSTGTTVGPLQLGNAASFTATGAGVATDQGLIAISTEAAAAHVRDQTRVSCSVGSGGTLYGRSKVDAAADNDILTEIVIEFGGW